MKIVFTDDYAKACGMKSIEYIDECKVRCNKNETFGTDSAEILYRNEVVGSYNNKIIEQIALED